MSPPEPIKRRRDHDAPDMHTSQIGAVPLILLGNLLLSDKNGTSDALQRLPVLQP